MIPQNFARNTVFGYRLHLRYDRKCFAYTANTWNRKRKNGEKEKKISRRSHHRCMGLVDHQYTLVLVVFYFVPRKVRSIAMSMSVHLFVCLSARITRKPYGRTSPFCACSLQPCGSVLLRRRCDTLCTSSFMDDVMFSQRL